MQTTAKLSILVLLIIGLSACGRTGDLEPIKITKTPSNTSITGLK